MAVVRHSRTDGSTGKRSFGFRGFYMKDRALLDVHSCDFDSIEGYAYVSPLNSKDPLQIFRVKVRDLILLEDTSRFDKNGLPIFEGDVVRGMVENEFGSLQELEGVVLYDEEKWGFCIEFDVGWKCKFTGFARDVEVIGTIFDEDYVEISEKEEHKDS